MTTDLQNIEVDQNAWESLNSNDHIFLTGDAGTGKTTLIKKFCQEHEGEVILLAPTGVAAVNCGGMTIHKFFFFPARPIGYENIVELDLSRETLIDPVSHVEHQRYKKPLHLDRYRTIERAKYLIIDEISMVRADIMDQIAWFFHKNFDIHNGTKFAGLKVIMVGDLSQLPPVVGNDAEKKMISDRYKSEFFFDARCWNNYDTFKTVKLTKIWRQTDPKFINILNGIKNNTIAPFDITDLNKACVKQEEQGILLCSTNKLADERNAIMMANIKEKEEIFKGTIEGEFNDKDCPVEKDLRLKAGCRVMIIRNDPNGRYHNGSMGTYQGTTPKGELKVLLDESNVPVIVERYSFESVSYSYDSGSDNVSTQTSGVFIQFPVRVAYAITIHKSQGKTFDAITVDMGRGAFAHGQLYVALSRCRTMEGITLRGPVKKSDILFNKRVLEFNSSI